MYKKNVSLQYIYYIAFALFVFWGALSNSMFGQTTIIYTLVQLSNYICIGLIFFKMIFEKNEIKIWVFLGILSVVSLGVYFKMGSSFPMIITFLIMGSRNCDPRKLVLIHLICVGMILIVSQIASSQGIIEDRIFYFYRAGGNVQVRHSMGMTYVTIWAAMVFFIVSDYLYLRIKTLKKIELLFIGLIGVMVEHFSHTRIEVAAIFLIAIFSILYSKIMNVGIVKKVISLIIPISMSVAFMTVFLYQLNPAKFSKLDQFFSGRLAISSKAIVDYGINLFGQNIRMQGNGTVNFDSNFGYFFIDSAYINYTLQYGILFVLLLVALLTYVTIKLYKKNEYFLIGMIAFSAVHGIIISSIFVPYMCPWFVIAYATASQKRHNTKLLTQENKNSIKNKEESIYGI